MGKTGLAMLAAGSMALSACAAHGRVVGTIPLPPQVEYPEGIAADAQGRLYVASAADGIVLRMRRRGGSAEVLSGPGRIVAVDPQLFPEMLGLKLDDLGRLWIMGGRTGKISVLDANSGKLLDQFTVTGEGSTLNDAVVLPDGAYVTDTARPILWRLARDGTEVGGPTPWIDFTGTPLQYGPGRNLNGIVADPSGRYLIVIQMDKGLLFRIDTASKEVTPIAVVGGAITNGDGLVLDGRLLYIARQAEGEIATIRLAPDFLSGEVVSRFRDPALTWLATAAKVGDELLVVDSQFNRHAAGNPVKPFSLVAIPIEKLRGD
ncbi:MAG: hypothetical protein P0Y56_15095 [Candidatus Andeanibacterium colombiense]|uniref:Sugar lactone lactonase YvrE n=1 Tax=Candidatus Andeanibacterium colombiense TaxID=3121345 RepID=A0AAJ5X297_9SPHN|nr:MAG: hypothetical protein P0Y56_15095 [Sphingomonadaceae bacterium]